MSITIRLSHEQHPNLPIGGAEYTSEYNDGNEIHNFYKSDGRRISPPPRQRKPISRKNPYKKREENSIE